MADVIDQVLSHMEGLDDDELAHYGVKGMRWGVRKDRKAKVKSVADALNGKDPQPKSMNEVGAKAAKDFTNNDLPKINKSWSEQARDTFLTNTNMDPNDPDFVAYKAEIEGSFTKKFKHHLKAYRHMEDPNKPHQPYKNKTRDEKVEYAMSVSDRINDGLNIMRAFAIEHEASDDRAYPTFVVRFKNNLVSSVELAVSHDGDFFTEEFLEHINDFPSEDVENYLEHYGVKGMRWGVRRSRKERREARANEKKAKAIVKKAEGSEISISSKEGSTGGDPTKVITAPKGGVLATSGGKNAPVSDDAIVAAAIKRVASENTISSLSNQELETITRRMNLENNYKQALEKANTPAKPGVLKKTWDEFGKKFVQDELRNVQAGKSVVAKPMVDKATAALKNSAKRKLKPRGIGK